MKLDSPEKWMLNIVPVFSVLLALTLVKLNPIWGFSLASVDSRGISKPVQIYTLKEIW